MHILKIGRRAGVLVTALSASLATLVYFAGPAHSAVCSNATFCGGWYAVCKRTLPPNGSVAECDRRRAECLSSGCFQFNRTGPRCKSNPNDLALTTSCKR
jgi:hypothetical protein